MHIVCTLWYKEERCLNTCYVHVQRGEQETIENFIKWKEKFPINKDAIDAKIKQEIDDEKTRATADI